MRGCLYDIVDIVDIVDIAMLEASMGDMLIRNIPDTLKSEIERLAVKNGASLSETAREALRRGVGAITESRLQAGNMPAGDKLRSVFLQAADTHEGASEFRRILEEIRQAPDRPLPTFE